MTETTIGTRTATRTCPLCEAGCGLGITVVRDENGPERVQRIRGDMDDVFSYGFICRNVSTLTQLHDDPDRLRTPMVKCSGREALGVDVGNPGAHSLSAMTCSRALLTGLGTRARFSAPRGCRMGGGTACRGRRCGWRPSTRV